MKKHVLCILSLFFGLSYGFAQDFSAVYTTQGTGDWIVLRDVEKTSTNHLIVGFDYHPDTASMPMAGIMKTDLDGNILWSKTLDVPDAMASCTFEVKQNADGNYLLWGLKASSTSTDMLAILSELTPDGTVVWTKEYNLGYNNGIYTVNDIEMLDDGNMQMMMTVYDEMFIMETDPDGNMNWGFRSTVDTLGGGKNPGYDWRPRPDGGGFCTGKRTNDFSLNRYDTDGNLMWNRSYSLHTYSHVTSILDLPSGNILLAGYANSTVGGGYKPIIMELDEDNGDMLWMKQITTIPLYYKSAVHLMYDGEDILMILDEHDVAFNNQTIVKIDTNGNVLGSMISQPDLNMMDYNKVVVMSEDEHYNVGAFKTSATDDSYVGVMDKRTDLFSETCILTDNSGHVSVDYTDVSDTVYTPIEVDWDDVNSITVTANDVSLKKDWACEMLSDDLGVEPITEISIYPNPTNGNVTVSLEGEFNFSLVDLNGKLILSGKALNSAELDLIELESGIYALNIQQENQSIVKRIVKQ